MTECPDENVLSAWAEGSLSGEVHQSVADHLADCTSCRQLSSAIARRNTANSSASEATRLHVAPKADFPVEVGDLVFDKYEIVSLLGAGGMGCVFRAHHRHLDEPVALKFLLPTMAANPDAVARFAREARSAAKLKSEHVGRVYDFEQPRDGTPPCIVMEYLEGESLDAYLKRVGPLSLDEAIRWALEGLEGLAEAHAVGFVHRDIKPANLFIHRKRDGRKTLKVLDFGIAKSIHPDIEAGFRHTMTGAIVGSPRYMAPEQISASTKLSTATDVWAFGCVLYEMVTGKTPFNQSNLVEMLYAIQKQPYQKLDALLGTARLSDRHRSFAALVDRCLAKAPTDRFANADEIAAALRALPAAGPSESPERPFASPETTTENQRLGVAEEALVAGRAKRGLAGAMGFAIVVGFAAATAFVWLRPSQPRPLESAPLAIEAPPPPQEATISKGALAAEPTQPTVEPPPPLIEKGTALRALTGGIPPAFDGGSTDALAAGTEAPPRPQATDSKVKRSTSRRHDRTALPSLAPSRAKQVPSATERVTTPRVEDDDVFSQQY